jgi:hypothetical protein
MALPTTVSEKSAAIISKKNDYLEEHLETHVLYKFYVEPPDI